MKSEQPLHHLERKILEFPPRPLHQNRLYSQSSRRDTPRDLKEKELTNIFNSKSGVFNSLYHKGFSVR